MNTNVGHVQHKMVGRENGTSEIKTVFNGRDITSLEANILFKKKKHRERLHRSPQFCDRYLKSKD